MSPDSSSCWLATPSRCTVRQFPDRSLSWLSLGREKMLCCRSDSLSIRLAGLLPRQWCGDCTLPAAGSNSSNSVCSLCQAPVSDTKECTHVVFRHTWCRLGSGTTLLLPITGASTAAASAFVARVRGRLSELEQAWTNLLLWSHSFLYKQLQMPKPKMFSFPFRPQKARPGTCLEWEMFLLWIILVSQVCESSHPAGHHSDLVLRNLGWELWDWPPSQLEDHRVWDWREKLGHSPPLVSHVVKLQK